MALSKRILAAAVLVAWLGSSGAAGAQEESSISANLAVTTDYVFRGYTQTGEDPAVQGGLDWGGLQRLVRGRLGVQYRLRSGR